ncbi:MAG: hypothetical protein JNL67_08595 [Planctomycetaceae bacterium]|nr:hypothetical protein [Planctomycetaceae bacterium]
MNSMLRTLLLLGYLFGSGMVSAWAQPTPQLRALNQHVAQVGTTVPIQAVAVEQGEELYQLQFSHPEMVARMLTEPASSPTEISRPKYGHFEVAISPRVAPGIYEVAAVGRHGVSNPRSFLVSANPVVIPEPSAVESSAGFPVPVGSLIWDRCRAQEKQRYQLELSQPQSVNVTVHAQSLDSNAIPVLILRDEQGLELARSRAVKRQPAQIELPNVVAGKYSLEVFDFLHQGGPDYYFALDVQISEPITMPVSIAATENAASAESTNVISEPASLINSLKTPLDSRQRFWRDPAIVAAVGDWASLAGGLDFGQVIPAPTPATMQTLPVVMHGLFGGPSQPVRIDFQGGAGQGVWLEVVSASAGQLTDPQMLLYRVRRDDAGIESLQLITHQDDQPGVGTGPVNIASADPAFLATLPEEGHYCVMLMDHITSPRPNESRQFLISIGAPQPDFQLIAHPLFHNNDPAQARPGGAQVQSGGTVAWHVHLLRRQGFAGPVELTAAGLPEGVVATPVVVHPAVNQATLVVHADMNVGESCGDFRIVGRSLGEPNLRRVAWPAAIQYPASPRRSFVQWSLIAEQRLRVTREQEAPLGMNWAMDTISIKPTVPTTAILNLQRRTGGGGQCVVRPIQLPPGWSIGEVTVPPDQTQANISIQVPAETSVGRYTISFHNETKVQWKPTAEAAPQEIQVWLPVPTLTIEVVAP